MATSSSVIRKGKLDELRHEILSYKPGKAVPCDDERVVFPDKLVIGTINLHTDEIVHVLRSALYGDIEASKLADEHQTSTEDPDYLTDSIYVIKPKVYIDSDEECVRHLAGKVGCMVLLLGPTTLDLQHWIKTIKRITGHVPICAKETTGQSKVIEKAKIQLKKHRITDIYDVPSICCDPSVETRLQWLHLLHGCLKKGDEEISADLIQLYSFPSFERLWNQGRKGVTEAQKRHGEEIKEGEEAKKLLQGRITDLEQELNEFRASRTSIVSENGRLQDTMKVEQERHEHSERAMMENEKKAKQIMETYKQREMEFKKKLQSKDLRIETMAENVQRTEEKARRQVEQLKRETWKLRTKIQLESEIRSAEQKKKAEIHQWSFIPWMASGKQAPSGTASYEDNSTGGLGRSDTLQAGEEPPDDEFAGILQQIADDLYDEAKIDSLDSQLGILHGDIQRALMTNVKFNRVTSDGTRHMLKQWREGVSRKDERIELTKALKAAKLFNLAELYLSEGVAEEQIDAECANEDDNDQQLFNRDETSLEQDRTKGHIDIQALQGATASSNHTPLDGHTGDMASKTQEDLTDGSRGQHLDQSPERSTEDLDGSEGTSEEVSSEEVHPGNDMNNVSSIQPSEQSPSHEMQVLPEAMSEIAPLVSYDGKPNEESNTLDTSHTCGIISNEEYLISQLVLIDTSPEKILLIFLVKIIIDVSQKTLSL